jgi:hypothetical protein
MVHDCFAAHLDEVGCELLLDFGAVIAPEIANCWDATVRTFISEQPFFFLLGFISDYLSFGRRDHKTNTSCFCTSVLL